MALLGQTAFGSPSSGRKINDSRLLNFLWSADPHPVDMPCGSVATARREDETLMVGVIDTTRLLGYFSV